MLEYKLLDSGNQKKLEQVGNYRLIRPSLNAYWPPSLPDIEWDNAVGHFSRNSKGVGKWTWKQPVPANWIISYAGLKFLIKPTDFGHLGFFPEQKENWNWLTNFLSSKKDINAINMFAYSGGSSLAVAKANMNICHLDAAKGMIDWAKENLKINDDIPDNIRWITDDVNKFVKREIKRGNNYSGIVLDPPSFGRGSGGQIWKIEEQLQPLLKNCRKLMGSKPEFILLSMHTHGYSPISLERILFSIFPKNGSISSGEMTIDESTGKKLPAGIFAKWVKN